MTAGVGLLLTQALDAQASWGCEGCQARCANERIGLRVVSQSKRVDRPAYHRIQHRFSHPVFSYFESCWHAEMPRLNCDRCRERRMSRCSNLNRVDRGMGKINVAG